MNNNLISREALKKCAIPCEIHNGALTELCVPLYQIDNAPTVEGRATGEWIRTALYGQTCLECNQCGKADFDIKYDNFCPNCGADMRKGGAE